MLLLFSCFSNEQCSIFTLNLCSFEVQTLKSCEVLNTDMCFRVKWPRILAPSVALGYNISVILKVSDFSIKTKSQYGTSSSLLLQTSALSYHAMR